MASVLSFWTGTAGARAAAGPSWFGIYVRPAAQFAGKFLLTIVSLPFIVLPALLPLSALLLMMPAIFPEETVVTEVNARASAASRILKRFFALLIGLSCVAALLLAANELVLLVGLRGTLRGLAWVVVVYLLDLVILLAIGNVPLKYNLRNLLVRWRITLLTSIAFTVVVALLIVMLAFVNGMYKVTEESGQPANIMILADGSTDEVFSNLSFGDVDLIATERCTLDELGNPLPKPIALKTMKIKGQPMSMASRETYAIAIQDIPGQPGRKRFVQVRGIVEPELAGAVHDLRLKQGRWFSDAGVQASANPRERDMIEAVLGSGVAREFGKNVGKASLAVGDQFTIADRTWVVAGIMDSDGTTYGSEVWAKQDLVAKMFNKLGYNSMVMRIQDDGPKEEVARRATTMAYHLRTRFTNPKVNAQTETDYFNKQSETSKQFLYAIIGVAVIMAVGGVFGVMNTMFAAIAQRIKDIGMMRIIGFKRWQLLVSFLLESLAIAVIGGLIGCALGMLINGVSATSSISSGTGGGKTVILRLTVDATVLLSGLLFTLVMGRLGGLIPALSAMRLKILESLR